MKKYEFINDAGQSYTIKPINKFLIGLVAEKRTTEKLGKPDVPKYLHVFNTPTGESYSTEEVMTPEMVESSVSTDEDKNRWFSYKAKLKTYMAAIDEQAKTLSMVRSVVEKPSADFVAMLDEDGLTNTMTDDEIKLMWIVSEVAPTEDELKRFGAVLDEANGVKSDDVNKVADDFRTDLQGAIS